MQQSGVECAVHSGHASKVFDENRNSLRIISAYVDANSQDVSKKRNLQEF